MPKQAQRVFLCLNKRNIGDEMALVSDLLSLDAGMDCVVSWLEIPGGNVDERLLRNEILDTQALILWVTPELLESMTAGVFPFEYRIAREYHTPILPIARTDGLFSRFSELAGPVHGIAMTDLEYRIKLKAQLELFLSSDEIVKEIQTKAFTSKVFLSYRKIDIDDARQFMKEFHNMKGFEPISIWYDHFLTGGRDFNHEIMEAIKNSDAFALLVTPNMATEGNYVQRTEYPFARQLDKTIVPAEAVPTEKDTFIALFPGAGFLVRLDDSEALRSTFLAKLGKDAVQETLNSERAYLLGIAYLKGFGVETDFNRGVSLLEDAAKDYGLPAKNAARQLAEIYENDNRIVCDLDKTLLWRKRAATICEQLFGALHSETASAYCGIATAHRLKGDYQDALDLYLKALDIQEKILRKHPDTADTCYGIAAVFNQMGDPENAIKWYEKCLKIRKKVLGKRHINIARVYDGIASIAQSQGDAAMMVKRQALKRGISHAAGLEASKWHRVAERWYGDALSYCKKSIVIHEKLLGVESPDTAITYNNIGMIYFGQSDINNVMRDKAMEWLLKALVVLEKTLGVNHLLTVAVYLNIAQIYEKKGDIERALELNNKVLAVREKICGKHHPDTALAYRNMGMLYYNKGMFSEALEYFQKGLDAYEKTFGEHQNTALSLSDNAATYLSQGDLVQALNLYLRAFYMMKHTIEKDNPLIQDVKDHIRKVRTTFMDKGGDEGELSEIEARAREKWDMER